MYILANDGIETSNSYPFQERVSYKHACAHVVKTHMIGRLSNCSNRHVHSIKTTLEHPFLAVLRFPVEVSRICWQQWLLQDQWLWQWTQAAKHSGYVSQK
jgi:hypothetical protein